MAKLSANQIKYIKSLSQKKFRDENNVFIVEGEKLVNEAVNSSFKVLEIYKENEIGRECMERISNLSSPSPILAVVEQKKTQFSDYLQKDNLSGGLYLGLDCVKDPGNMGTIIRMADWFGIDAIFAAHGSVEIYNPKVVQATMGAIFRTEFIYCNLTEIVDIFNQKKIPVYGTFLEGENIYTKELSKNGLIVMGNESNGISPELKEKINQKLHIPNFSKKISHSESLNVAVATAIICSEFRRML